MGKRFYSETLQRNFNIDYVTCVGAVFHKRLAIATNDVMKKMNDVLYKSEGNVLQNVLDLNFFVYIVCKQQNITNHCYY